MEGITLIHYQGNIRYETVGELIHILKQQAPLNRISLGTYKKILLIMIESLENIMKHSENSKESQNEHGLLPKISIFRSGNKYVIQTANQIGLTSTDRLKTKIDRLNSLDQQGIKDLYKETITDGVFSKSGGAGLGLIEIAKISCNPLIYELLPLNKDYAWFTLKITVDVK